MGLSMCSLILFWGDVDTPNKRIKISRHIAGNAGNGFHNFVKIRLSMNVRFSTALLFSFVMSAVAAAGGNTTNDSFNQAKRLLETKVYHDHRVTFYCQATFDEKKNIELPQGFLTPKHEKRARRVEWEHVVPAENFGRAFIEWREGDSTCVDKRGRSFKGRKCAEKANPTYRLMQADMYNLYPAIGAVNALRSNKRFGMLPTSKVTFGTCAVKIDGSRVEPPEYTRGAIARTTLYMSDAYPQYRLSDADRKLMQAWDKTYPVDAWECRRAERIARIQGNENTFVSEPCRRAGLTR